MRVKKFNNPLIRAAGVVAAIAIVVSGVTFAALQSQGNIIQGNTIETGTADLKVSLDDQNYTNDIPGFDFKGLIPGGPALPADGYSFYLKNGGSTSLNLRMTMLNAPTNPDGLDLSKFNVIVTPSGTGQPITFSLQDLMNNAGVPLDNLDNNGSRQYKIQVAIDPDAYTGMQGETVSNLDFDIDGTAVVN